MSFINTTKMKNRHLYINIFSFIFWDNLKDLDSNEFT